MIIGARGVIKIIGIYESKKAQFGWIRVLFVAFAFFLVFGLGLAAFMSQSAEFFTAAWGESYPLLAWLINGMNIWIFIGALLGLIGAIVWGLNPSE